MNPIDKMAIRAIWRQERTGIGAVDGLVRELRGATFCQLCDWCWRGGGSFRRFIVTELGPEAPHYQVL